MVTHIGFARDIAQPLPMWTICETLGLRRSPRAAALHAEELTTCRDAELDVEAAFRIGLSVLCAELIAARRADPGDDLMSALLEAGQRLTGSEVGALFMMLFIVGNETPRDSIKHGVLALKEFPTSSRCCATILRHTRTPQRRRSCGEARR